MKTTSLFTVITFLLISASCLAQVTDKDGNIYKTIKLGNQEWMASNLNTGHFRNGDVVPEVKTLEAWKAALAAHKPACCYFKNENANGKEYGRLYNWYAITDPRGLAPKGWHIPSDKEWISLADQFGGKDVAGKKLKSASGWSYSGNGKNESGFNAMPGGFRDDGGGFGYMGQAATWWTSTEKNAATAGSALLAHSNTLVSMEPGVKGEGRSVRCVKD